MARDDFEGQVGGGGVNNFEFTVTDAWFGESEAFTEKTQLHTIFLHWAGTTDLEDDRFQQLTADGFHPSFNLDVDWIASADGKTVKYDGPSRKPRFGKWYGRLCDSAIKLTEDVAETDQDPLAGTNHPTNANMWIGTKWYMEEVEVDFGTMGKHSHLMPTKYLGRGPVAASPTSTPALATAAAAGSNGSALRDQVVALAKAIDTYQAFQAAALALDGVSSDTQLVVEIANPASLYEKVRA